MKTSNAIRFTNLNPFFLFFVVLILCFGCGSTDIEQTLPQQTETNNKEFTPEIIKNSSLIVVGKVRSLTTTGASNAHIKINDVLFGKLQSEKNLVIVFNEKSIALENKDMVYIFCLKQLPVKNKSSEEKTQWVQFSGTISLSLAEATQANIDRIKKNIRK